MKDLIFILILALLFHIIKLDEDNVEEIHMFNEDVIELTDIDFEESIKKYENIFVIFYAPWCGHCQALAPEFSLAATELKEKKVYFAKIDATANEKTADKYEIEEFPTLFLFKKGEKIEYEYEGINKKDKIIMWIKKHIGEAMIKINNLNELDKFKQENKICIIYFGNNEEDLKILEEASKDVYDFNFGTINTQESFDKFKVRPGSIILFRNFEPFQNIYTEEKLDLDSIKDFIYKNVVPAIIPLEEENIKFITSKDNLIFITKDELTEQQKIMLTNISKKFKEKMAFVSLIPKDEFSKSIVEQLKVNNYPSIRISDNGNNYLYEFKDEINEGNIIKFIEDYYEGKLKRIYESQPIPKEQTGKVVEVVGLSFNKEIIKNNKNVLVLFYGEIEDEPNEGEEEEELLDKRKIFLSLSEKLHKTHPDIVLAEINLSENECEEIENLIFDDVCLYLYVNGKKNEPIKYEDDFTLEKLDKFINTQVEKSTLNKKVDL